MRKTPGFIILQITVVLFILNFSLLSVKAMVKGSCSNCHTMHNSQNGLAMNFDGATDPNSRLLRVSKCVGCHAVGGNENSVIVDGYPVPQVMHTNGTDLAAGNFGYINGIKGSGASQTKGHNVVDLVAMDTTHLYPPGGPLKNSGAGIVHPDTMPARLTCAGLYGCHGNSHIVDPMSSMMGAHHTVADTTSGGLEKPVGTSVGNSYRFLVGVEGLEMADWQNRDKNHHNEYKNDTHQLPGFPNQSTCGWCHGPDNPWHGNSGDVLMQNSGTNFFCMRCHPQMHSWIDKNSAWFRHPVNVALPGGDSEIAAYTVYSVDAPVTRSEVPDTPSSQVEPGTDAWNRGPDHVACLSCHKAHATDHADLLRWDYPNIVAGNGTSDGKGCIICHTKKDD